jgi:putative DNA primase/helicase
LNPPEEVTNATKGYRDEMDMIGHFLKEKTEAGEYVFSKALYSTYSTWCDDSGERPIAQRTFSQAITERGYASKHTKRGNVFIGLSITESVKDGEG